MGATVGIPLPAAIQDLQSELRVFPVSHPPFWFPVEQGWILEWFDIVSNSGNFDVLENKRSNLVFVLIGMFLQVYPRFVASQCI